MTYERRYTSVKLERRGQRGPNDANGVATYQSILGALLVEMWHSQLGIATVSGNVDTWTGQVQGTVLSAISGSQRPTYAPDGTVFAGKNVVNCAVTGSLGVRNGSTPVLLTAGTRPWWYAIARQRASAGSISTLVDSGKNAIDDNQLFVSALTINGAMSGFGTVSRGLTLVRHSFQMWADGTNANLSLDNTAPTQVAGAGSLANNVTSVAVGCAAGGPVQFCDCSVALYLMCSSKPSAAQITALETLGLSEFPA